MYFQISGHNMPETTVIANARIVAYWPESWRRFIHIDNSVITATGDLNQLADTLAAATGDDTEVMLYCLQQCQKRVAALAALTDDQRGRITQKEQVIFSEGWEDCDWRWSDFSGGHFGYSHGGECSVTMATTVPDHIREFFQTIQPYYGESTAEFLAAVGVEWFPENWDQVFADWIISEYNRIME